jgi:Family of unknown function (DUF5991)
MRNINPKQGTIVMAIRLFTLLGIFVALPFVANAQNTGDWIGEYVYEHSHGENAGGVPMVVEYRLRIGTGCRIVADGYQTNETIICKVVPRPDGLIDVNYVSSKNGDEGTFSVGSFYRIGERLFSMSKRRGAIYTGWGAYSPFENKRPVGRFFRRGR